VNERLGWAARATDGIYRTTNSGLTFEKVLSSTIAYPGGNRTAHFRSVGFASATRGWAGNLGPGSYDASVTDTNILYETFDGGDTWNPVLSVSATDIAGLCAMHVLDSQHIFGGGRVRGPAHFIKTTDGGAHWSVTNLTAAGVMGGIMDVYFHDPMNGFLVGMNTNIYAASCGSDYSGRIVRTTDGGVTWSPVADTPVLCSYFWKMSWPSTNTGYATLQQNGAYDTVIFYKTIDGGATWTSNGVPLSAIGASSFFLQGIGFVSEEEGWMGGSSTVPAPFNFIHTTNGGLTWEAAGYSDTASMNRIRFQSPTFGYASGRKLHVYGVQLAITSGPDNLSVLPGATAGFSVTAAGAGTLSYQWRFEGGNLPGADASTLSITNVQLINAGHYDVVVSDISGSITSSVATLTVVLPFHDDFDGYSSPVTVTGEGNSGGYDIVFNAASGPVDFSAVFGFDYSAVTYPTNIPSAPNSVGGTTRGLRLSINKDATGASSTVQLYPTDYGYEGDFSLTCDVWLNWSNPSVSTEHAMFGINHSGALPLRPGLSPSDGLFFAFSADGDASASSGTLRDYSVFHGVGAGAPVLMITNNTSFGPAPLLGSRFDNLDPGMAHLFPARAIPGWGTTVVGSAGLQWVEVEVRQANGLVSWALNGTLVAQYTNVFGDTRGQVMLGYLDHFSSIGDANSFAVLDNVRVDPLMIEPIELIPEGVMGESFRFSFDTERYAPYVVEWTTGLSPFGWMPYTNLIGDGLVHEVAVPLVGGAGAGRYYRVVRP